MVGLGERSHHSLSQLSGGEQQRVAIAVSLANSPTLLLADEPTGEVDSQTALTIYQIFQTLNRELGLTILIVSHDTGIARHVQRVVAIRDGKLASETVRQTAAPTNGAEAHEAGEGAHVEEIFEELVVLDSAGRLQIPKDYLQKFNIQGRAKLEMTEEGILIVPASTASDDRLQETRASEFVPTEKRRRVRDVLRLPKTKK
jgi:ABC-type methionine transport system ATPase subunit